MDQAGEIKKVEASFAKLSLALDLCKSDLLTQIKSFPTGPAGTHQDEIDKLKRQLENAQREHRDALSGRDRQIDTLKQEVEALKKSQASPVLASPKGMEIITQNLQKELQELKDLHVHTLKQHREEVDALKKEISDVKTSATKRQSLDQTKIAQESKLIDTPSTSTSSSGGASTSSSGSSSSGSGKDMEFTTCSNTGRQGPSQSMINFTYRTGALAGKVTSKNGLQVWKVPKTGAYRIKAFGSAGGSIQARGKLPGCGAIIQGDFDLKEGQELSILVGQEPATTPASIGGGGGGSFVVDHEGNPLLIAGGGAGASVKHECHPMMHGTTHARGQANNGGTEGRGGYSHAGKTGGGGGGFKSDGTSGGGEGGKAYLNGGGGGEEDRKAPPRSCSGGGFGGGGGGEFSETGSSGAGGGWSGGGSGEDDCSPAGGGASWNKGRNPVNVDGSDAYRGPGKVIITPL